MGGKYDPGTGTTYYGDHDGHDHGEGGRGGRGRPGQGGGGSGGDDGGGTGSNPDEEREGRERREREERERREREERERLERERLEEARLEKERLEEERREEARLEAEQLSLARMQRLYEEQHGRLREPLRGEDPEPQTWEERERKRLERELQGWERGMGGKTKRVEQITVRDDLELRGIRTIPGEEMNWEEKLLRRALKLSDVIGGTGEKSKTWYRGEFSTGARKAVGDIFAGLATTIYAGEQIGKRALTPGGRKQVKAGVRGIGPELALMASQIPSDVTTTVKERPLYALGYGAGIAGTFYLPGKGIGKVKAGKARVKVGGEALKQARASEEIFKTGDLALKVGKPGKVTVTENVKRLLGDINTLPKSITEAVGLSKAVARSERKVLSELPQIEAFGETIKHVQVTKTLKQHGPLLEQDIRVVAYETFPMKAKITGYGKVTKVGREEIGKPGKGGEFYEFEQLGIGKPGQRRRQMRPELDEGIKGLVRIEKQPGDPYRHITGMIIEDAPIRKAAMGPVMGKTKGVSKGRTAEMFREPDISIYGERGMPLYRETPIRLGKIKPVLEGSAIAGGITGAIERDLSLDVIAGIGRTKQGVTPDLFDGTLPGDTTIPIIDTLPRDDIIDITVPDLFDGTLPGDVTVDITDLGIDEDFTDITVPDLMDPDPVPGTDPFGITLIVPELKTKTGKKPKGKRQKDYYDIYHNLDAGGLL